MIDRLTTFARQYYEQHQVASWFLALAVVFGPLFMIAIPPTQAADETTHFHRAYQLSQGELLSQKFEDGYGANIPAGVYSVSRQLFADIPSHYERTFNYRQVPGLLKQKIDPSQRVMVHHETSAVYSPVGYIPQVGAIWVGRIVWPSTVLMYYLARAANFTVWLALVYLAIRLWGAGKWAVAVLALTPMSLSQAVTASPDALTNAGAFLFISAMLHAARKFTKLENKHLYIMVASVCLLSLAKPAFFVFSLLALLFTKKQLGGERRFYVFVGTMLGGSLLVAAIWNSLVSEYSHAIAHYYYPTTMADAGKQVVHSLTQPWSTAAAYLRSYLTSVGDVATKSYVGRLGWWDTDLPLWTIISNYGLIGLSLVGSGLRSKRYSLQLRQVSLWVFAAGFVVVNGLLYLTISKVGAPIINTPQGRYFIAFSPLLIPVFCGLLKIKDWEQIAQRVFPVGITINLATALFVIGARFT